MGEGFGGWSFRLNDIEVGSSGFLKIVNSNDLGAWSCGSYWNASNSSCVAASTALTSKYPMETYILPTGITSPLTLPLSINN